ELVGSVRTGVWLSTFSRTPGARRRQQAEGALPLRSYWRSENITTALAKVMADRSGERTTGGRWWAVTITRENLPADLPPHVSIVYSAPDYAAVPPGAWSEMIIPGSEGDFLQAAQTGPEKFDGVLLAPLPADHPQAWRCYNATILARACRRVHRGGVICIRTQARRGRLDAALSVARTFYGEAAKVGAVWAVADFHRGEMDLLLLAGPARAVEKLKAARGAFVVPAERLWSGRMHIRPITIARPMGLRFREKITPAELQLWLLRGESDKD
ncbi:MAG: hypothetical protein KAU28_00215, partial [Phycisphaerae bacterium]|nr:hypothetical protein [Phycisphaerae bacterium]